MSVTVGPADEDAVERIDRLKIKWKESWARVKELKGSLTQAVNERNRLFRKFELYQGMHQPGETFAVMSWDVYEKAANKARETNDELRGAMAKANYFYTSYARLRDSTGLGGAVPCRTLPGTNSA